jgi:hypothetical protein
MQSIRNYLIIMVGITVLVVLAGGYFIYGLAQANIRRALEVRAQDYQIKLTENKLAKLEEAESKLEELKRADGSNPSRFDFITERTLPESDSFATILTIFNQLQEDESVNIESVSKPASSASSSGASSTPNTPPASDATSSAGDAASSSGAAGSTPATKATPTIVSIKASGSRDAVMGLLKALEKSARIFDFSTMKIDGGVDKEYSLDMQYKVYSYTKPSISPLQIKIDEYETKKGDYE